MNKTPVFILKWNELSVKHLTDYIDKLNLIVRLRFAKVVVVKVNLAAGQRFGPETGVVTNPDILYMLVETLTTINHGLSIIIAESDSTGRGFAKAKFEFQQYANIFSSFSNVQIVDLSHTDVEVYSCAGLYFVDGVVLSSIFKQCDFFITLGKMKTHTNTTITGCLKNQFGCLPDMDKEKYHPYLPVVIADINSAIKPDLCLLEACPAMEGNGPIFGKPKNLGILLFGVDPVAIDATASLIMGFYPEKIPTITTAQKAGIGSCDFSAIELLGVPIKEVSAKFDFISAEQQFYVQGGFVFQRIANSMHKFGHRIHLIQGTGWLLRKVIIKLCKMFRNS